MRTKSTACLASLALVLSACTATHQSSTIPAADAGNSALGYAYAEQNCASCHAIGDADMHSPDPYARSFNAIANTPGLTPTALNAWLNSSHTNMPDLIVDPDSIDDLHAYLSTLKRREWRLRKIKDAPSAVPIVAP